MRQRIMIALALVLRPSLLVADEPTTSLDVLVEAQILAILADLKSNFEPALLLITHNLGIVAEACDRVAVMYAGRIVEQGAVADVFARPAAPLHARSCCARRSRCRPSELHFIPGAPPDLVDPPTGMPLPPALPATRCRCAAAQRPASMVQRRAGHAVECWLHGPAEAIPAGGTAAARAKEIAIADEA